MLLKVIRVFAVSFVCAILIAGSFVTNNFGISQAYIRWAPFYSPCWDGFVSFHGCYYDVTHQAPYDKQPWSVDPISALPSDTIPILLITLAALILSYPHLKSSRQKRALHSPQTEEVPYPARETRFKKYKYHQSGRVPPKRHAKYYEMGT